MNLYTMRNESGIATPFYLLPELEIEISASEIRHQARAALDRLCADHGLLSGAVCDYIAAHGLYREG
jgi:nicotinic acid mononucleotide adenylyltransferase